MNQQIGLHNKGKGPNADMLMNADDFGLKLEIRN